jgi:hypothetical protein
MRFVTYGLSPNITEICDSVSEAEIGAFSLLFGHPGTKGRNQIMTLPRSLFDTILWKFHPRNS